MPKKRGSNEEFLNPGARRFRPPEVMPRKLKAAIYVRVSTRYQVDKDSLPFQKEELINYIKYALNIEDYEIFEDAGYSAKNTSRPKFQEMMSRIRNNEFTHLVVYKIDRISRNLLDFAQLFTVLSSRYAFPWVSPFLTSCIIESRAHSGRLWKSTGSSPQRTLISNRHRYVLRISAHLFSPSGSTSRRHTRVPPGSRAWPPPPWSA